MYCRAQAIRRLGEDLEIASGYPTCKLGRIKLRIRIVLSWVVGNNLVWCRRLEYDEVRSFPSVTRHVRGTDAYTDIASFLDPRNFWPIVQTAIALAVSNLR